jgi:hypothetical protein
MEVSNAQVRIIQLYALQGWPLSIAAPSWGQSHLYQSTLKKIKPIRKLA